MSHIINIKNIKISNNLPLVLIAGPCQIESVDHTLFMVEKLTKIAEDLNIPFIYKSSFDKANRTSIHSKRGVGEIEGLCIFKKIKSNFDCIIVTDIHKERQCETFGEVVDILQIPAFLCRQTDLLKAAAKTKKVINVKKGQFVAPQNMNQIVEKLEFFGAKDILLTERGTCFGYNNLVSDMRGISIMKETKYPVIFDATHSVQQPGGLGNASGGSREFVEVLAKAAVAVGVAGIFIETHQDPNNAPSDGPCMLHLDNLRHLVHKLKQYDYIAKHDNLI